MPLFSALQPGDLAIVDFSAKRADDGEELPYAARTSMRLDTDDADSTFLPGERRRWPGQGRNTLNLGNPPASDAHPRRLLHLLARVDCLLAWLAPLGPTYPGGNKGGVGHLRSTMHPPPPPCWAGIVAILEGMRPGEEKETAMTFPTDGEPPRQPPPPPPPPLLSCCICRPAVALLQALLAGALGAATTMETLREHCCAEMPATLAPIPRPRPPHPGAETFQPATLRGAEVVARVKMVELFAFELPEVWVGGWGARGSAHHREGREARSL
jgi:hypothetical protein